MTDQNQIVGAEKRNVARSLKRLSPWTVLQIPAMRRLWIAQLVSTFGDFLALFAIISLLTFRLHETPAQITALQLAYLIPIAVMSAFAGPFVDRWPVKRTLVSSDVIRSLLCLLLIPAFALWHYYVLLAAISVLSAFFTPAQGIAIRQIVPFEGLRSAQVLMQQVLFGMRVVGPPLAILVFRMTGSRTAFVADAVSFAASAVLLASVFLTPRLPELTNSTTHNQTPSSQSSVLTEMRAGLLHLAGDRQVLIASGAMATSMFVIGCISSLLAVYIRDVLKLGSGMYSLATLLTGLGLFAGANLNNLVTRRIQEAQQIPLSLGTISVGLVLLAAFPHRWSVLLADALIGLAVGSIAVLKDTYIQQRTPVALLGRVSSTMLGVIFFAQIVGLLSSGLMADWMGVRTVFALFSLLTCILAACIAVMGLSAPV